MSAQLLSEEQTGARSTNKALNRTSTEERECPDDVPAQDFAAIINNCSLDGEARLQKAAAEPMHLRSSPGRRKRQVSADAPVSPSKRRLSVGRATDMGRNGTGAGKLGRPGFIFDDLNKDKGGEVREEIHNVPKAAVRSLRSKTAAASVAPDIAEPQTAPVEAAKSGSGGPKTRSRATKVTAAEAERQHPGNARGEQPQQRSTDIKRPTRRGRPKKSVKGTVIHSAAQGARGTRSGDRQTRNTGPKVVITQPDWSKKPEDTLKVKKGSKSSRTISKPSVSIETSKHQDKIVQGNGTAELPGKSLSSVTKKTHSATRSSKMDGGKGGETPSASVPSGQAVGDISEEHNHRDEEGSDDESNGASEHEEVVEEPGVSEGSEAAGDAGSPEGNEHEESVENDRDHDGREEAALSDSADVASEAENEDSDGLNGRPKARMPLFGLQVDWEMVLRRAMEVGLSDRNGVFERKKPKLATSAIKAILEVSSELKQLFLEYGPLYAIRDGLARSSSSRATVLRGNIDLKLRELIKLITQIDESKAGKMRSKMIQDIYAHGIPELVFLLNEVFLCYLSTLSIRASALKTCLRVHGMVLDLCQKASQWHAKPETDRPIKRPTRQILPILRYMQKVFRTTQRNMQISLKSEKQELAARRQLEDTLEAKRGKYEHLEREKDAFVERQKIALDQEEEQIRLLRRNFTSGGVPRSSSSVTPPREDTAGEAATSRGSHTPIERVEVFAPRGVFPFDPERGNGDGRRGHDLDDTASIWTDEERKWLMIGLQIYQGATSPLYHVVFADP